MEKKKPVLKRPERKQIDTTEHQHIKKLKLLGVYDKFVFNFTKQPKNFGKTVELHAYNSMSWCDFVSLAFYWDETSQGSSYWYEISLK